VYIPPPQLSTVIFFVEIKKSLDMVSVVVGHEETNLHVGNR